MGVFYEAIPASLFDWIRDQKVFWVATAPLSGSGHVNISPKGGPNFGIIDERTFWYLDLSGSGSETISHLYEQGNGRITIMFNAFQGPPRILRLWGKGRVLEHGTRDFSVFVDKHAVQLLPGTRSIIVVDIHQVGSSCGFSVPFFDFKEFRNTLNDHHVKKAKKYEAGNEKESFERYWALKNAFSMDGLPAMHTGLTVAQQEKIAPIKKMVGPLAPENGVRNHCLLCRHEPANIH
ncbi:pyridoxamine phosphate oxidase family protein [Talaromyces proteolyticus]|uniref:Pyridoxamine phosphate oxidase family protein n=1 Tax=Talaromyces proteolyticus TaxID=1131652 RepID=A0AAD4PV02_9EURO|nr:pyridoxamine phosphate oxidase family protein [Talaromyces proteolyticus]KAH8692834.1 pyridoxamine phosphate oxidase family protein [Talaromyces proteolyticus]